MLGCELYLSSSSSMCSTSLRKMFAQWYSSRYMRSALSHIYGNGDVPKTNNKSITPTECCTNTHSWKCQATNASGGDGGGAQLAPSISSAFRASIVLCGGWVGRLQCQIEFWKHKHRVPTASIRLPIPRWNEILQEYFAFCPPIKESIS